MCVNHEDHSMAPTIQSRKGPTPGHRARGDAPARAAAGLFTRFALSAASAVRGIRFVSVTTPRGFIDFAAVRPLR
jgi:hypothetical protein